MENKLVILYFPFSFFRFTFKKCAAEKPQSSF